MGRVFEFVAWRPLVGWAPTKMAARENSFGSTVIERGGCLNGGILNNISYLGCRPAIYSTQTGYGADLTGW